MGGVTDQEFHFGDFTLDQGRYRLQRGTRVLRLERLPMDLLILLLQRGGELVSREEIAQQLWGKDVFLDVDHGINTAIRKLRRVLRDDPAKPRFIETVVGKGYRFAAPVSRNGHGDLQAPSVATPGSPGTQELRARAGLFLHGRGILLVGLAVLALLSVALLYGRRAGTMPPSPPAIHSLAVLPLKNLSGDPAQDYFADGMTEELIGTLSNIHGLRVISRTSAMYFKERSQPLPEIARALHVDAIVEGSVLREGPRVRVTVQLIRAATDEHIWAKDYDLELRSVLALQEEVAANIAAQIKLTLTPQDQRALAGSRTLNPEAHELYLKGRYYVNQRTEKSVRTGVSYFRQALAIDPDYALAYCGLADAYTLLGYRGHILSKDALADAKTAALKALQLDNTLADAHASLAFIAETHEWDWQTAEREYRRALQLNPGNARVHHWYAGLLTYEGRLEEGIDEERRARELDPLSLPINTALAGRLLVAGRYTEAMDQLSETLRMDPHFAPAHNRLGWAYLGQKKYPDAIREFEKAIELSQPDDSDLLLDLGFADAMAGRRDEALKILATLKRQHARGLVPSGSLAVLYGALGERDQAFAWLQRAYLEHDPELTYIKIGPRFDPLRQDPRFKPLVQRIGLPG